MEKEREREREKEKKELEPTLLWFLPLSSAFNRKIPASLLPPLNLIFTSSRQSPPNLENVAAITNSPEPSDNFTRHATASKVGSLLTLATLKWELINLGDRGEHRSSKSRWYVQWRLLRYSTLLFRPLLWDFFVLFINFVWFIGRVGLGLLRLLQCCFTSTETVRTIRDREPRTSTSTFTQLLSSVTSVLLYIHRDHKDC